MLIRETQTKFIIEFNYSPSAIEKVKQIPGRRFDYNDKTWWVPLEHRNDVADFAKKNHIPFGNNHVQRATAIEPMPELEIDIPLKKTLFPFQKTGVAYALKKKRLIIGDEQGLGKTAQAIATIVASGSGPVLIICPSSLKRNWEREYNDWTGKKAMILTDSIKATWPRFHEVGLCSVFITNFESLKKYFVQDIKIPEGKKLRLNHIQFKETIKLFNMVVIDEAHRVKSTAAQQTKFTKGICSGKEYILAMTGTPIVNKPKDLISQLGIIDRIADFGGYSSFVNRYCAGHKEASNLSELQVVLKNTCFFRRNKSDVLPDLPAKQRQIIHCEIDPVHRKEYTSAETDLIQYLMDQNYTDEQLSSAMRGEVMVRIQKLKNIAARGKMVDVISFVSDIIEQGEKLILFIHHKEMARILKAEFAGSLSITGDDGIDERQTTVDKFQNDPSAQLIICSIRAAGVGITLTASSRVAFAELDWTAAIHDQCEDRAHRIGQKDSVNCFYFIAKETIEEHIYETINRKRDISMSATGQADDVETSVISDVIHLLNKKA